MAEFTAEFGDGGNPISGDGRLDAPSFHRNCRAITDALSRMLDGRRGHVLEIASGTGQHIIEFARAMPDIVWWPSDHIRRHLESIEGWRHAANCVNLRPSFLLDAEATEWPLGGTDAAPADELTAIVCLNMLHIAPWSVAIGLLRGAAQHLALDGILAVYGPFRIDGEMTADSNASFDAALRNANPAWGVRDTADLRAAATEFGLTLHRIVPMPSNNFVLIFHKSV